MSIHKLKEITSKILYKDGWSFEPRPRDGLLCVTIKVLTAEQDPKNRTGVPFSPSEVQRAWERSLRSDTYEYGYGGIGRSPMVAPPAYAVVTRDVLFFPGEFDVVNTEFIVRKIFDMVYEMEIHELREFFRYQGLCVEEPHPEMPRELAFQKGVRGAEAGVPQAEVRRP